jgi:cytoskeleton protein RodZ
VSEIQEHVATEGFQPQTDGPSLGLLLQKAREARGLTVSDVVQTLKFSPRQIEAVEANDLTALPGSMFARGVVRSYARFLKLDPEPLLALMAADTPAALPDVRPPDNMGNATPRSGLRQIPPLVAFSVLLLIATATMIGWHFLGPKTTAALKTADPTAEPATVSAPAPEPSATVVAIASAPAVSDPSVALPTPTPAADAAPAMPADARQLAFRFRGKSWVEVKDASQQIILTGQYVDGGAEMVAGRPPFQIVIGNAALVDLTYAGQPIDLKPYTRAEVARLSLD